MPLPPGSGLGGGCDPLGWRGTGRAWREAVWLGVDRSGAVEELRDVLRAGVLSLRLLAAHSLADGQRKGLFYGDDAGQLAVQAR